MPARMLPTSSRWCRPRARLGMSAAADILGIVQLWHAPLIVLVLIFVALAFDFINGFSRRSQLHCHSCLDARAHTAYRGILGAAFNFLAVFVFWHSRGPTRLARGSLTSQSWTIPLSSQR